MSEKSAAPDGQVVIKGRVSEHGLPVWQMPERVAIAFPEGRCRIVRGRHGCFLYHPADHFLGKAIETYGECCELELGANAGYLTVPLARMVGTSGRVVAFEPQPAIHRLLCANVALNGLPQVDCVHAAVGAGEDVVEVPVIDPAVGGNFGAVSLVDVVDGARTAAVPLVSLDRACGGLERLDVVKIDVEGMELEVLKGARELIGRFRPVLVPENDRASRSAELVAHLLSLDYRCYWLIHPLYNPGNFFGVAADLYPRTASYNMLCVPAERPQPSGLAPITDPAQHPLAGRR